MHVLINIALTFLITFSAFWAVLPAGFGLGNFQRLHTGLVNHAGAALWWMLMLSHPLVLILIWTSMRGAYWWLLLPLVLHCVFFPIFGRDVGTN